MTRHFQNEIARLKKQILRLAAMVEDSLSASVKSVTSGDSTLAAQVIDSDSTIDMLEVEVEEECLKILALHQPVAADLRYVVAVLKINSDLERIADLAVNIAEATLVIANCGRPKPAAYDLPKMLDLTVEMVRDCVDALVSSDTTKARLVCAADDQIDDLDRSAVKAILEQLDEQSNRAEYLVNLISVSRNLERIADHATNIAEDVIYMIDGEIVRHRGL